MYNFKIMHSLLHRLLLIRRSQGMFDFKTRGSYLKRLQNWGEGGGARGAIASKKFLESST